MIKILLLFPFITNLCSLNNQALSKPEKHLTEPPGCSRICFGVAFPGPTCRRTSCCGSTRAGRPAGSSPCLRCGWRRTTGRAPAPPPWPPLPPHEEGAAGPAPARPARTTGPGGFCSSPTPPRTLRGRTGRVIYSFTFSRRFKPG